MALPISFRWDEDFVRRIDEARGMIPRSAYVRAAVERSLVGGPAGLRPELEDIGALRRPVENRIDAKVVRAIRRSSQQAKAGTGPRLKGGK